jgi:polar amino acid transport system substrate-binding protein
MSIRRVAAVTFSAIWAVVAGSTLAAAQTCGSEYVIKEGDTLSAVAARAYGNPAQWTLIFYANQDRLGTNVSLLVPGLSLRVPCPGGTSGPTAATGAAAPAAAPTPADASSILISSVVRQMEVLTADGYPPYTGRALEGGGMLTQLVSAALDNVKAESKGRFDYGISWVNGWSAHLNPLLVSRAFDVGFPWAKPNCADLSSLSPDAQFRCQRFFYSEPLHEVLTTVFVKTDSRLTTLRAETIAGTTLCRPVGHPTSDLDENGRNWLRDGKVKLIRPVSANECFQLLAAGTVDGVAIVELVGRSAAIAEGMGDAVRELDPPLSLTSLHVVISRSHPHARTMLYYINAGLNKARESGDVDRIIERHLSRYWDTQTRAPNASLGALPAAAPRPASPRQP